MGMCIDALQAKIRKKKNPTVLGLDLQMDLIPQSVLEAAVAEHGKTIKAMAEAYLACGQKLLVTLAEIVPAVKLNTAFFEVLGADGISVMQKLCAQAKSLGYYVILETMRTDLEAAASLQAQTYLGDQSCFAEKVPGLYEADALCIGAFTGSDGIKPYLPYCKEKSKNIFILTKTPNKSSREVQDLISGDRVIYTVMMDLIMRWSVDVFAKSGYSQLGAVIGATHPQVLREMRDKYDRLFFLVTGYGVSGGMAKDVQHAFDKFGHGAVVEASRYIIGAWQNAETDGSDFAERACAAALKMKQDISKYVTVI